MSTHNDRVFEAMRLAVTLIQKHGGDLFILREGEQGKDDTEKFLAQTRYLIKLQEKLIREMYDI